MTIEKERELGTCTSCKARGRIWSSKTADAYPYDTEKLCKKCSQPKILTKAFDMAWDVVKGDDFERKQFDAKMHKGGKKHSCPTCKQPKRLSDEQKKRRYQCDECADKEEGAY